MKSKIVIYIRLLLLALVLYIAGICFIFLFQRFIIFRPEPLPKNYSFDIDSPHEELFLITPDSNRINALFFPTQDSARGVVLYFHGNADNLARWSRFHSDFTERGYDFFAIDYRGYGKSTGQVDEDLFYQDARLAYNWLAKRYPPDHIIIYGRSLGSGPASHLAAEVRAKMLILETPFDNIRSLLLTQAPVLILPFELKYKFPNDEHIQKVSCPIYIFHGTKDRVVPYRSAERLKKHLKAGDFFYTIENGGHKDLSSFEIYQRMLDSLLIYNNYEPQK